MARIEGIVTTINSKPEEEWLIVHHKKEGIGVDIEQRVRALIKADQAKVHFGGTGGATYRLRQESMLFAPHAQCPLFGELRLLWGVERTKFEETPDVRF